MNKRMIAYMLGQIMKIESLLMILPLSIAFLSKEGKYYSYFIPIILLLVTGFALSFKKPANVTFYAKEGFISVGLAWIILSLYGALPFCISGDIPSYTDAFFETVSGFTTTGSTILTNIEGMRKSNLFWRSFTHWIGGMGILVFVLAILPQSNSGDMHMLRAEVPGPKVGKLVSKIRFSARILYGIYIVLTGIEVVFLLLGGMPLFDSVVNSFGTAGTGGFAVLNASIAGYNSPYCEGVIAVFMLIFGINFNVFYLLLLRKFSAAFRNQELWAYLGIVAVAIVAIMINICSIYGNLLTSFRFSSFQVISIITTSGFATADYMQWPEFSQCIIMLLMFIGACAGSTGGGLKVYRVVLLFKIAIKEIGYTLNPRSVSSIKMDGKPVETNVLRGVANYTILYFFLLGLSLVLICVDDFDIATSVSAVITCFNNVGPGLGDVGPAGNFSEFSDFSKIILCADMLLGRLEIFPLLMLFKCGKR